MPLVSFLSFLCSFRENTSQIVGFCPKLRGWRFPRLGNLGSATDLSLIYLPNELSHTAIYFHTDFFKRRPSITRTPRDLRPTTSDSNHVASGVSVNMPRAQTFAHGGKTPPVYGFQRSKVLAKG